MIEEIITFYGTLFIVIVIAGLFLTALIKAIWFDPEHGAFMFRVWRKLLTSKDWEPEI